MVQVFSPAPHLTDSSTAGRLCHMVDHSSTNKLELLHCIADLIEKNGLWVEIARLGMTREFIEKQDNLYARIIMELDFIEAHAPEAVMEVKKLKTDAALMSLKEQRMHNMPDHLRVA